jgi:hypothetical protein
MNDVAMMEIFYSSTGLNQEPPYFGHGEEFSFLNGVGQRAVVADFENDIGAFLVGKCSVEFDDVRMAKF